MQVQIEKIFQTARRMLWVCKECQLEEATTAAAEHPSKRTPRYVQQPSRDKQASMLGQDV